MGNFTPRPPVVQAVRWTGDNLAEFEAWAQTLTDYSWAFEVLDSGLQITITPTGAGPVLIPSGQWAVGYAGGYSVSPMEDAAFQANYQPLPDGAPLAFDITGT